MCNCMTDVKNNAINAIMTDVKNKSSLSAATPIGVAADNELFFALPFVSSSVKLGYDVHKLQ